MKTFEDQIREYRAILEDVSFPSVKEWKSKHPDGKVFGLFPVYVPYELPHAAGALPVGLYGAGGSIEIDYADSRIQSFVCSIARSTLELGLRGLLNDFDALWFPSICDVARNLSGVWQANFPNQQVEYIHFPQNITSPAAVPHYRSELERLQRKTEALVGKTVSQTSLADSIEKYNHYRSLASQLYEVKTKTPWLLSSYEVYVLLRLGTLLPVEEHSKILEGALRSVQSRNRQPRDFVRVLLEGSFCEQPPIELLQVIEEAGCYIVNDDLLLHTRWFTENIPVNGDPLLALAESYLHRSIYSSVRHYGDKPRKEQFLEKIRSSKVDGVVFCSPKFCEPALLDYVVLKDELTKRGIAYITFEYEEKMGIFESIRTQVETFVESVMFFS